MPASCSKSARYRSDDSRNIGGTFTFASLDAYDAGQPTTFTQRSGNPLVEYSQVQFGGYVQDDVRLARSLSMSVGLRYEVQTHTSDYPELCAALRNDLVAVQERLNDDSRRRGIFYEWYDAQIYEQTLRVDGTHQTDLVVQNPGFPDPFVGGDVVVLPSSRYLQDANLTLPRIFRTTSASSRPFGRYGRVNVGYSFARGHDLFRGRDINAPLPDGTRPESGMGQRHADRIGWTIAGAGCQCRIQPESAVASDVPVCELRSDESRTTPTARSACRRTTSTRAPSGDRR